MSKLRLFFLVVVVAVVLIVVWSSIVASWGRLPPTASIENMRGKYYTLSSMSDAWNNAHEEYSKAQCYNVINTITRPICHKAYRLKKIRNSLVVESLPILKGEVFVTGERFRNNALPKGFIEYFPDAKYVAECSERDNAICVRILGPIGSSLHRIMEDPGNKLRAIRDKEVSGAPNTEYNSVSFEATNEHLDIYVAHSKNSTLIDCVINSDVNWRKEALKACQAAVKGRVCDYDCLTQMQIKSR